MYKIIIAIPIILLILYVPYWYTFNTKQEINCYVKNKERIVTKSGSSKYLIFCKNKVLENTDSLLYWKWNSSDMYNNLDKGKNYKLAVYGLRIPILSMYQNVIKIIK